MIRVLVLTTLAVLASATVALAARGEPRDELDAKDMARARSIVLKKTDLAAGFRSTKTGPGDGYCAALDESALTRSGKAESPAFVSGTTFVSSRADQSESEPDRRPTRGFPSRMPCTVLTRSSVAALARHRARRDVNDA